MRKSKVGAAARAALLGMTVLAVVACGKIPEGGGDDDDGDGMGGIDAALPGGDAGPRQLDVLFVIDNSGTMAEEQDALAVALPAFLNALAAGGELPSLHLGVITSDLGVGGVNIASCEGVGDDGAFVLPPACGVTGHFLRDVVDGSGGRDRNYVGDFAAVLSCMTRVGTAGCGFEQHLQALRRALDGSNDATNGGFLRPGALLAIVVVADEDDCSASDPRLFDPQATDLGQLSSFRCTRYGVLCGGQAPMGIGDYASCGPNLISSYLMPLAEIRDFLIGQKGGDPDRIVFGVIGGPPNPFAVSTEPQSGMLQLSPSCTGVGGAAVPAVRLEWMTQQFSHVYAGSICDSFTTTMGQLAAVVRTALAQP